jgi:hypothetical protein
MSYQKKCYKIVRLDNGKLKSCYELGTDVTYKVGELTLMPPNGGQLAVFDTLESVKAFATLEIDDSNVVSFETTIRELWLCMADISTSKKAWLYYHTPLGNKIEARKGDVPKGTIFANRVKLIRRLTRKDPGIL